MTEADDPDPDLRAAAAGAANDRRKAEEARKSRAPLIAAGRLSALLEREINPANTDVVDWSLFDNGWIATSRTTVDGFLFTITLKASKDFLEISAPQVHVAGCIPERGNLWTPAGTHLQWHSEPVSTLADVGEFLAQASPIPPNAIVPDHSIPRYGMRVRYAKRRRGTT